MTNAYISGTGFYVPPRVVTNDELVREYGMETSDEWIQQRTGIRERRFAADGVGSADLGLEGVHVARVDDLALDQDPSQYVALARTEAPLER